MKKLSSSFFDSFFCCLQDAGVSGVCRIGLHGQVLQSGVSVGFPPAGQLRFGLQESIEAGGVHVLHFDEEVYWVFALENRRVVHGGLLGGGQGDGDRVRIRAEGERVFALFYKESAWSPLLLHARRQDRLRRAQLAEAVRQQDASVAQGHAIVPERMLLAAIRAGDRTGARRLINERLSVIYLSAPQPVVLQARVIELLSSLTRAAVEDNPLLASLIVENQRWTAQMVQADTFEMLSMILMQALDAFIDAVHLHGSNRTNMHVHKALLYISEHYHDVLGLQQVAQHTGLSVYRLAHLFREHTGKTVVETIRAIRLQRAEMLLRQTLMTCAEIGYAVGFADQSYFSLHFKRYTGQTPGQYRRARVLH